MCLLDLRVKDLAGHEISNILYWLSSRKEVFKWEDEDYRGVPLIQDSDFTALEKLPSVQVDVRVQNGF